MRNWKGLACAALVAVSGAALAQEEGESQPASRLTQGWYVAPMASYTIADDRWRSDDGYGGVLGAGYRSGALAVELSGYLSELGADLGDKDTQLEGAGVNALVFPLSFAPNLYALVGAGMGRANDYASIVADPNGPLLPPGETLRSDDFSTQHLQAGLGHLFALSFGRYDFGIRAEALARYTERKNVAEEAPGDPRRYNDYVFNLGLQLPLGLRPEPPPPPPVAVVPVVLICSDGQDNDADGLVDYPADPGCTSAEDDDETDPPQCSDGKDNDGDGLIDFPADKGCTGADDNDEVNPCKAPAAGERVSLKGCGTGDVIVLNGVNFEFDRARLTVNAKTILDNVAEELVAYPEIKVELGGHTDAKGSDEYNQVLSDKRAAAVLAYLKRKGVAAERMTSVGYGESQPVADNETDEGRELNRRVELKVTEGIAAPAPEAATEPAAELAPAADAAAAEAPAPDAETTSEASVPVEGEAPAEALAEEAAPMP